MVVSVIAVLVIAAAVFLMWRAATATDDSTRQSESLAEDQDTKEEADR